MEINQLNCPEDSAKLFITLVNILNVNRFVDFSYEKQRKISLRCLWWSNIINSLKSSEKFSAVSLGKSVNSIHLIFLKRSERNILALFTQGCLESRSDQCRQGLMFLKISLFPHFYAWLQSNSSATAPDHTFIKQKDFPFFDFPIQNFAFRFFCLTNCFPYEKFSLRIDLQVLPVIVQGKKFIESIPPEDIRVVILILSSWLANPCLNLY